MGKGKKEEGAKEGTAENVLNAFLPGLGGFISSLKKSSPEFKKRFEERNSEIEKRVAAGGSKRPVIDYNIRVRTLAPEHDTTASFRPSMKKRGQEPYSSKPKPRGADIFDEGDKIVVVMELPDVKKEDIKVEASGNIVEVSAKDYHEKIALPSEVSGKPVIKFKNGILELRLVKKGR